MVIFAVWIRAVSDTSKSIREYGSFAFFDSLKCTQIQTLIKYRNKGSDSSKVSSDTFICKFFEAQNIREYGVLKSRIRYSSVEAIAHHLRDSCNFMANRNQMELTTAVFKICLT